MIGYSNALGIDASDYDGVINWKLTASRKVQFATIRATWGTTGIDTRHTINMTQARDADIKRSPYHWFDNKIRDGKAQAEHFLRHFIPGEIVPTVDLENYRLNRGYLGIGFEVLKYLAEIKRVCNQTGIIYTSPSYIKSYLYNCPALVEYPLIVANWDADAPGIPRPFIPTNWCAWQYTGKGDGPYYGFSQVHDVSLYVWNGPIA
jgi:GH25 family lysozyme M1 (1,4-beta-N-acetylmuramidase)